MWGRIKEEIQEQAMRFQHRALLGTLEQVSDPARADLGKFGIDTASLQKLVAEAGQFLTEAEKDKIVALANRPEVKERLPVSFVDQKIPVPDILPRAELEKVFAKEWSPTEVQKIRDLFADAIKKGVFQVFVSRHGQESKASYLAEEETRGLFNDSRQAERIVHGDAQGESPILFRELSAGYRKSKALFAPDAHDALMMRGNTAFADRQIVGKGETGDDRNRRHRNGYDFGYAANETKSRPEGVMYRTSLQDLYIFTRQSQQEALAQSKAQIVQTSEGRRLYRVAKQIVESYKCVSIQIGKGNVKHESRTGFMAVTIVLDKSVKHDAMLRKPDGNKPDFKDVLRALKANPGFFLEALRAAVGSKVFYTNEGEDSYYSDNLPASEMMMQLDVPEFRAVGVPDQMLFQRIP